MKNILKKILNNKKAKKVIKKKVKTEKKIVKRKKVTKLVKVKKVNKKYADLWPNISEKKDPPADHKQFKDVKDKYEKYFKENLE